MTTLLLATLIGASPIDARFPLSTEKVLHVYPSRFPTQGPPLDEQQFPGGPWFPALRLKLSDDCTGLVMGAEQRVQLVVRCNGSVTQTVPLASFTRLESAYEKTTNSWLRAHDGTWELVTSTFLRDFELDAPGAPNITGQTSSVSTFKKGTFELVSTQLPAKRSFPIRK